MKNTITLKFADSDDLKHFQKYLVMAKEKEGTVTGLYCGLMCSALKRCTPIDSPGLLEACKTAEKMLRYLGQTKLAGYSQIQSAISTGEAQ